MAMNITFCFMLLVEVLTQKFIVLSKLQNHVDCGGEGGVLVVLRLVVARERTGDGLQGLIRPFLTSFLKFRFFKY